MYLSSLIFLGTEKYDRVITTKEMFIFLPLMNNSIIIRLIYFVIKYISNQIIKYKQHFSFFYLDCILQIFYKHHPCYSSIK